MKVKYVGFGGGYAEYPCYEDESGKLYFDLNDGRNGLNLYTGAYRDECDFIEGEPYARVKETVECDDPFVRHVREMDYQLLSRWISDCDYFLGNGNGYEPHLYFNSVEKQIAAMKEKYNSFADNEKPEWLTMEDINNYENEMLKVKETKRNERH